MFPYINRLHDILKDQDSFPLIRMPLGGGVWCQASCKHSLLEPIRQHVYALALGHEDLNDHEELCHAPALQTAASRLICAIET